MSQRLIPELDVADLDRSLKFYTNAIGFDVLYARPNERFVMLALEGIQLMLEEAAGPGRRFRTAPLEFPYGRGMNLQIEISDVDAIYARTIAVEAEIVVALEERWYPVGQQENGNRQFVLADPDGYLLRFFTDLGTRPAR